MSVNCSVKCPLWLCVSMLLCISNITSSCPLLHRLLIALLVAATSPNCRLQEKLREYQIVTQELEGRQGGQEVAEGSRREAE
jgi:hypothetical protein